MISKKFLFNPRGAIKNVMDADIPNEMKVFILDTRGSVCEKLGMGGHNLVTQCFCDVMETDIEELKKKNRDPVITLKRQILGWAVRHITPFSHAQTGFVIARDHATIIYSTKKIFNLLSDSKWGEQYVKNVVINAITMIRKELELSEVKIVTKEEYLQALDVVHRYQAQNNLTS